MDEFKISMAAARVNARKTQAEVAEALHVGKATVISWENGKTSPTMEKAQEFCDFCNSSAGCPTSTHAVTTS